jgi:hypothetical protein
VKTTGRKAKDNNYRGTVRRAPIFVDSLRE